MRLLLFNLATDADDPVLGFTSAWVRALARWATSVDVITMRAGRLDVPPNVRVYSLGKERGYSEPRRAALFYWYLARLFQHTRIDACFSHMAPLFSAMAAPLLRARGVPLVTWYAHPKCNPMLQLAHHVSDRMVASVPEAYPYRHDKLCVIGQGIDTDLFSPGSPSVSAGEPPLILCAGRLSPVKDHPTLLQAVALLRARRSTPFQVALVGKPLGADAEAYVALLHDITRKLGIEDVMRFEPSVPPSLLPAWYRRCTVHVNLTPAGFGDKVAWESMSCARVTLVANTGFRETLGRYDAQLLFPYQDAHALAARLEWALALHTDEQAIIGEYLRQQVIRLHSLAKLPARLGQVFDSVRAGRAA